MVFGTKKLLLIFVISACTTALYGQAQILFEQPLKQTEWPAKPTGDAVLNIDVLRDMMDVYLSQEDVMIRIRYPGGDRGSTWARELQSWLIALGVASAHTELAPGSGFVDAIVLEIQRLPKFE